MFRLLLGLLKGAVIGGGLGYGAYELGLGGWAGWFVYCSIGAVIGLLVGKPIWSHLRDKGATLWTPALKAVFGAGIGAGLYALVKYFASGMELELLGETRAIPNWQFIVGAGIGAVYGAFTELDDSIGNKNPDSKS